MRERPDALSGFARLCALVCALTLAAGALQAQTTRETPPTRTMATPSPSATATPSPTPTPVNWSPDPMLRRFVWRGLGPASMGGRIDNVAVVESNPYIIYVGFATGGVWKSTNNGTT